MLIVLIVLLAAADPLPKILRVCQTPPVTLHGIRECIDYRWHDRAWEGMKNIPEEGDEILFLKARALAGMKRYDDALVLLQQLSRDAHSSKIRHEALLRETVVLVRLKRYSEALQKYRRLIAQERKSKQRKNLILRAVKTAVEGKEYPEVVKLLRGLTGPEAFWWRGWAHFRMGEDRAALQNWKHVPAAQKKGGFSAQVLYWQATVLRKMGHQEQAVSLLQDLIAKHPVSYYAVLALGKLYPKNSDYKAAVKTLWKQDANPDKLFGIYPKEYPHIVGKEAKNRKLDPYLLFAMIWQESRFREGAVSSVGAIGLMQLMPQTALQVASAAKLKHFDLSDLFDPEINIRLGSLYLRFLKELFFDRLPHAVASYNAGEEAVARWLSRRDQEPSEIFIEEIPFSETQNYTKKVLLTYWMYRWLYERKIPER